MAKKVTRQDIFADDIFTKIIQDAKEFNTILNKVVKTEKASLTATKNFMNSFSGKSFTDVQKFNKAIKQTEVSLEVLNKTKKQQTDIQQKINLLQTEEGKSLAALNLQLQNQRKATKEQMKDRLGLTSLYEKESARLNTLRKKYKDIVLAQGASSKSARKLRVEVGKLDGKLKRVDAAAGQFQRSVGNYGKAFGKFGGLIRSTAAAFGAVGGIYLFANAVRQAFNTIRNFQKENAILAGVLNKTQKQIKGLSSDAKRLGSITAKTASEVTQLQIAYARLGFTQNEIIDLTEGTIAGSIALNAELAETANLTGAIVRTFDDLKTTDAARIQDVLAAATQKSALNFEKLQTSLPIVAGAANAVGIPFTKLVSLLGKLSDSGIDASSSATSLRNIFIESAKEGLDYEEILQKIVDSQDRLTVANDAFGKRAAVSATILAKNLKGIEDFDNALQDVEGTAQRMADEVLDTLDGKIVKLGSAWEGFILTVESGSGILGKSFVTLITMTTDLLNAFTLLSKTGEDFGNEAESGINKEILELIKNAGTAEKATEILKDELFKTGHILNKTKKNFENSKSIFDFLSPSKGIENMATEAYIGTLEKRVDVITKALNNPSIFIEENSTKKQIIIQSEAIERLDVKRIEAARDYLEELKKILDTTKEVEGITQRTREEEDKIYNKKLANRIAANNKQIAKNDKKDDQDKLDRIAAEEEAREKLIKGIRSVTNTLGEELAKRNQLRIENKDKEIAEREDNINMQQRLAENGLANSLAFEQEAKAKAEVERERLAEKQQRREKVLAYFNLLSGFAEKNPDTAAAKAFAQIAIAETISGFFKDGIEGIGTDNSTKWRNTGTDDYLVAVDKGEGITTAKGTAENKGLVTAINSGKVPEWFNQNMGSKINGNKSQIVVNNNGQLIREVKQVVQAIKNQPENSVNWDSLGNRIETQVRNGVKKSVRIVKGKGRI